MTWLKLPYFIKQRPSSLEKPPMVGKVEGKRSPATIVDGLSYSGDKYTVSKPKDHAQVVLELQ